MNTNPIRALRRARGHQQGFTLVELSVAVLIGLFLLGGLLTLVQDMRRTFGNQNQLGQMQDNERLAMTLITDVIQAAGYYPNPTLWTITTALPLNGLYPAFVQPGQAIAGTHNPAPPGDTISVQFLTAPNDGIINCTGGSNLTGANQLYVNTFSADAFANFKCQLNLGAPIPLVSPTGAQLTPLSGGVTNMQILYGVKRNFAIVNNNADTYLNASQMLAADWGNVICVKVTLTFDNSALRASQPGQPATIQFTRVITVMSRGGANT
ncbi:MAG TPA: PilW family protein [Steroidobacteraceae bacterium]|jgi:type IV pilus assembly protein PilW|nr:PilW family protein [Steroidobacteraceae bacterium]